MNAEHSVEDVIVTHVSAFDSASDKVTAMKLDKNKRVMFVMFS